VRNVQDTECHRSRREVLAGAAAVAAASVLPCPVTAAVPSLPPIKPAWLVTAEANLAADPWLAFNCFGPSCALTVLNRDDSIDPLLYDKEVRAGLASALSNGEATMAPDGRLFITDRGRKVWHEEWLGSWS
jgi:hypothetical protein